MFPSRQTGGMAARADEDLFVGRLVGRLGQLDPERAALVRSSHSHTAGLAREGFERNGQGPQDRRRRGSKRETRECLT